VINVIDQRWRNETAVRQGFVVGLAAAGDKGCPGLFGLLDVAHRPFDLLSGHFRAEISSVEERVVDGQVLGRRGQFVEELVFDILVDKES